jgi:hypothetical protein
MHKMIKNDARLLYYSGHEITETAAIIMSWLHYSVKNISLAHILVSLT